MKKTILMMAVALTVAFTANAQEFTKGDWAVNAGISLSETDPMYFGGSIEYGLADNTFNLNGLTFGIGAEASYASKYGITAIVFGVRAPFHYSPVEKLDLYTAPALLWARASGHGVSATETDFGWTLIGARYFFSDNVGAFLELGSNNALALAAGVAFKF